MQISGLCLTELPNSWQNQNSLMMSSSWRSCWIKAELMYIFLSKWMYERENEAWECGLLHSLHSCCFFYVYPGKGLVGTCFLNIHLCMDNSFKRMNFRINVFLVARMLLSNFSRHVTNPGGINSTPATSSRLRDSLFVTRATAGVLVAIRF